MVDNTYGPKTYRKQGGDEFVVASGGLITAETGSTVNLAGATLTLPAANTLAATAAIFTVASETATLSSNAVTVTHYAFQVTTESLTTAHTASQALVITKVGVAATDLAFITRAGGTNTAGVPNVTSVVCSTDTITINLKNEALATNAFNGTFKFNVVIMRPSA